jgi:hypothetical protein
MSTHDAEHSRLHGVRVVRVSELDPKEPVVVNLDMAPVEAPETVHRLHPRPR